MQGVTKLRASCSLAFDVEMPTPMVLMLRPRSSAGQWVVREEYSFTQDVIVDEVVDAYGNLCQRLVAPVGEFSVFTEVYVDVQAGKPAPLEAGFIDIPELPADTLVHLLPSRYCEVDRFGEMAAQIVGDATPGYAQVEAISSWVRQNIRNRPLSSTYPVSAIEVNQRGEGVCRDLAQLAITLCRALCIPARLVVGYLHQLEPMDIHAWFEAYVGEQWWTFDPAVDPGDAPRIAIARGRDATDVAIYNQYGPLLLPTDMQVAVELV